MFKVSQNVMKASSNLRQLIRIIPGAPPGVINHSEESDRQEIHIKACIYDSETVSEQIIEDKEKIPLSLEPHQFAFIQVAGMRNTRAIQKIGQACGLHDLEIEDILNNRHRPKVDFYEDHVFTLFRILQDSEKAIQFEHCALILKQQYVLLFRENNDSLFDPIINRIKNPDSRFRSRGTDYLAYALVDLAVDRLSVAQQKVQADCYALEETYLENTSSQTLFAIKTLHRKVIALIRTSGPTREVVQTMIHHKASPLTEDTQRFMNDVYDHVLQSHEQCLHLRDLVTAMINLHLSNVGQTTNEIMKFLTIMGSLFIPLTFIAGIYGMNFQYMPELQWRYGYFAAWGMMIATAIGLLMYFRKRGWF
jgi:magnesium transporter